MFKTVLIANRGEIACRAIRTLKRLGIVSVAVYSDADKNSQHVKAADMALPLHGEKAGESYLCIDKIIDVAQQSGAEAIWLGYGFLSESMLFAEACEKAGIVFVGPTSQQIAEFGLKHRARELAAEAGVPMTPGTGLLNSLDEALSAVEVIGYPVMLKSTAGGIGLSCCHDVNELRQAWESVRHLGEQFFSDAGVFLERCIRQARHIEVQIFGDGKGNVVALGERDCSLQRRNQKVVEEAPAPNLSEQTRTALLASAVQLGKLVNYRSVGTVEYIYDVEQGEFYFLEVNTRLQVEHPVTECVTGLDLVECMLRVAADLPIDWQYLNRAPVGTAIEVRLYAENPLKNFQPSPGVLTEVKFPDDVHIEEVRIDSGVSTGSEISALYTDSTPAVVYRQAGDSYILIEYGENVLDLALRLRIHLLMDKLHDLAEAGIKEIAPGVRSLQIRYDNRQIDQQRLVALLLSLEEQLGDVSTMKVPSRVIHLPMAFEDSATLGAVSRYQDTVRTRAPWLPNNVDFIQRINGLPDREAVRHIIFNASYLILGLGDVYLGAPCAVPIDPRHRLLSSKYNPARTFTAEGTVGIGGMYMCIYGMDSPGGGKRGFKH
ncbi:biotin carboxylase N-terminal domain-containing protein [Xenorhabdus indica]|uniref:ATP-binding protein n=1 Tax=Xenorhabdus indica TaxID=333964 RepID=UPI003B8458FC|nr:putative multifunctional urea amidolyase [Xenorhabdus indica]